MENGIEMIKMVKVKNGIKMVHGIKVNIEMDINMVLEYSSGLMVTFTEVNGNSIMFMVKVI